MKQPLLFLVYLILLNIHYVSGALIAVGKLESCFNNGTDALDCAKKIIVTLTLENNRLYQTESLNFNLACIDSPTGQCPCPCHYADDPLCTCRDLRRVISVAVTKSPVFAVYPLSQPRTFNGRPYEEYIPTGPGGNVGDSCSDSPYTQSPTCGWARAADGSGNMQNIPDSQGFCCTCPTFGGLPIYRGYRPCSFSNSWQPWNPPGAAYCLRYDDYWWYRGYVIGTYQLEFDIQVYINITDIQPPQNNSTNSPSPAPAASLSYSETLSQPPAPRAAAPSPSSTAVTIAASPPTSTEEKLEVTPSRGFVLNGDRSVSVRLLGDLDSYRQIQSLDGHWVMIPVQPGVDPNSIYTQNQDMWVILPPTMVSTTGECDKIGVSYAAFRIQSEKCDRPIGSCLRNQIYDLGEEDNARIAGGMETLYNITRYGGGFSNKDQVKDAGTGEGGLSLRLPIKGIRTSLVTLEVKADDVQLVVNRAPGKILSSEVCTFDGVRCGGFTAISGTGFLNIKVQNTGAVAAEFRAGILGCSGGVLPAVEEYAAIAPSGTHNFTFDIRMESDQEGNRTCTVVVTDSAGDIADSTLVSFYTNSTVYEPPPDQSDLGDKPGNPGDPPDFKRCSRLCPNLFNIKCLIFKGCWKRLIQAASTMALIAGIIVVLVVAIKQGWMKRCIGIIRCCIPKYRKKKSRARNDGSNDGGGGDGNGGNVHVAGRKRSRFKDAGQGDEPQDGDMYTNGGDQMLAPANKKMNSMYPHGGITFADAASAALAAKQWRHYQQQQLSLRQQQQQLQLQQQQMALENQLIGAYFDPNSTTTPSTTSPTSSPTPSQMMFYSPQTSPGPAPMPFMQPPAPVSPHHLTRAQTFQAHHMFQQQQQQQQENFSPSPSPLRRWNTFAYPQQQAPQFTAYNNPLSWQQQQQQQLERSTSLSQPSPFAAVGSPAAAHFHQQQHQAVSPPHWLVNALGENADDDNMAMTIGPMQAGYNAPQQMLAREGPPLPPAAEAPPPPPPPPNSSD